MTGPGYRPPNERQDFFLPFPAGGADLFSFTDKIVTTNLPFENWTEVLGSERLTGATLDRLTHRCHILETRGESYRLREAKRRRGRKSDQGTDGD